MPEFGSTLFRVANDRKLRNEELIRAIVLSSPEYEATQLYIRARGGLAESTKQQACVEVLGNSGGGTVHRW